MLSGLSMPGHFYSPFDHFGGPSLLDWNGDGWLDIFATNHHPGNAKLSAAEKWDLALNTVGGPLAREALVDIIQYVPFGSTETDPAAFDAHGTVLLDLDRDGVLDLYVAQGTRQGTDTSFDSANGLFWGELHASALTPRLSGGRLAAVNAGLDCTGCRSYGVYVADVNGDGFLDVLVLNFERAQPPILPSRLFLNRGPTQSRSFEESAVVSDHATAAVLTDFDQDGFATELVVLRTQGIAAGESPLRVYRWNSVEALDVADLTPSSEAVGWGSVTDLGWDGGAIATGDFNGDGIVDLTILNNRLGRLYFYYSSRARAAPLLSQQQNTSGVAALVDLRDLGCDASTLHVADFDLDGNVELLVICKDAGTSLMLQRVGGEWMTMRHPESARRRLSLGEDLREEGPLDGVSLLRLGQLSGASADAAMGSLSEQSTHHNRSFVEWCCAAKAACATSTGMWQGYGISALCRRQQGRVDGASVFDFDNDGFMDVALCSNKERCHLFRNQHFWWGRNSYIAFTLRGVTSNHYGIGATVLLTWSDDSGTERVQLRELNAVSHGPGCHGSNDHRLVFGLGPSGSPLRVVVRWPSRTVDTHDDAALLRARTNTMESVGDGRLMLTLEEGAS